MRSVQGRDPRDYTADVIGCEAHRRLAREAAQKSIVLLKNEGPVLPLGRREVRGGHRLARRHAQHGRPRVQLDAARLRGHTPAGPWRGGGSALQRHLLRWQQPEQAAEFSAVRSTGAYGGDRDSLALHAEDERLIEAVASANPRTIVAIRAGSAVITEAWRDKVAGILVLWHPARKAVTPSPTCSSDTSTPAATFFCTFPRSADDLPFFDKDATAITYDLWHGHRKLERDGATPAFPFGFGLSYTTFELANLRLARDAFAADGRSLPQLTSPTPAT